VRRIAVRDMWVAHYLAGGVFFGVFVCLGPVGVRERFAC